MFGAYYYHEKIRKCVAMFGRLFNDIYIIRKTSSGAGTSQIKIPLSYAPKRKYLDRIRENEDLYNDTKVAIKLPRMSFEITNIAYDTSRQLTKTSSFNTIGTGISNRKKFFPPVPYTINFQLNVYAKSQDDALQAVEQILPYFNPQYTLTIKPFPDDYPLFKEDIPIIIQGVSFSDDFEGDLGARRTIVYALDFEMKINFHGPISTTGIIRQADAALYDINTGLADSDLKLETISVTPDPIDTIGLADSDFGFTTVITNTLEDSS